MKLFPAFLRSKSPIDLGALIAEIESEIQSTETLLREISDVREQAVLAGDMAAADVHDQKLSDGNKHLGRLRERITGLTAAKAQAEAQEREQAESAEHERALRVREIGLNILKDYEQAAAALAQQLEMITAVNAYLNDTNRALGERHGRIESVYRDFRYTPEIAHTEIETSWFYPGWPTHMKAPVRSIDGSAQSPKPADLATGTYYSVEIPNSFGRAAYASTQEREVMVEAELRSKEVKVVDRPGRWLEDIDREVSLHTPSGGRRRLWDAEARQLAIDRHKEIVERLLATTSSRPSRRSAPDRK
jgi:hypothetical protein